jgi:hypothetical protein
MKPTPTQRAEEIEQFDTLNKDLPLTDLRHPTRTN